MTYGRLVSAPLVERGLEGTLRALLGPYIGEACAQLGMDRYAIPDPEHVQRLARADDLRSGEQVAALVIASAGTVDNPQREPTATTLMWDVSCGIVCDLGDPLATREAAQVYAAAIAACLTQQGCAAVEPATSDAVIDNYGEMVTLAGSHVWLLGEDYRPLPRRPDLYMGGAAVRVRVDEARALHGGPEAVPALDAEGHVLRAPIDEGEAVPIVPTVTVERE